MDFLDRRGWRSPSRQRPEALQSPVYIRKKAAANKREKEKRKKFKELLIQFSILESRKYDILFLEIHMENQINEGGQNTQQIGQNPVSKPIQIPEKPKINFWMVFTVVFALLFLGMFSVYLLSLKKQKEMNLTIPIQQSTPTSFPTATSTSTSAPTLDILPSPTQTSLNYQRPNNWKTVTISSPMNISLCLPPKWVVGTDHYSDNYREIFFERDPNYRPRVTSITKMPYAGGSRRNEYINSKVQYEYEPEKLKKETRVTELFINGKSILDIAIPSFSEELVFVISGSMYGVGIDYQNLVNDSSSAFRKDIYTIVGCVDSL